ncbi:Anaphase-promoting complex subunit 2 [Galdieria sulphuraria]|nr:Anaphase-promoting complex subunit 2 [Galdieria sulphuraria]
MSSPYENIQYVEELLTSFLFNSATSSKIEWKEIERLREVVGMTFQNLNIMLLDTVLLELFEDVFQKICDPLISQLIENLENPSRRGELLLHVNESFEQLVEFHKSCNELLLWVGSVFSNKETAVLENSFDTWFSCKLTSIVTPHFEEFLKTFAKASFHRVDWSHPESETVKYSSQDFFTLCDHLESLGLSVLVLQVLYGVILNELESLLKIHAEKNFNIRVLPFLSNWLYSEVLNWLRWILGVRTEANVPGSQLSNLSPLPCHQSPLLLDRMSPTCKNQIIEDGDTRRSKDRYLAKEKLYTQCEMFDIVVDYPDSLPALEDLKECLQKTDQKLELAKAFKSQLNNRLLHAGATTSDILATYVHAIHSLRIVDPDGNVLSYISKPVRKYLQNRSDTIRCIIYGITNESEDEAFRDLISMSRNMTEDDEEAIDSKWNPQPADAPYDEYVSGMNDAFGILLSIYGSKESFLNEYRMALADRILKSLDLQLDKETRNVELLKLRFGEGSLHSCDIMLRDLRESRRLLTSAKHEKMSWKDEGFEIVIRSKIVWPELADESFVPPLEIRYALDSFQKHFEEIKTPRKLLWDLSCGAMKLSLTTNSGQVISVRVSPLQGCVLMLFGRRSKWNIRQMCDELSVSADFLKRKIRPLVNQGLLQELDGEIYEFIESQERNFDQEELIVEEETVAEEERINIYTGILESFQALPLERIHKLLKVFVINPRYDKTEYELNGLLTNLVQQQKLQCTNGLFMNYTLSESFRLRIITSSERTKLTSKQKTEVVYQPQAGVVSEFLHEDFFHRKDFPNAASYFQPQKYFRSLESKSLGHLLAYSPEVSSTQDVARSLFESLNLKNMVVVAESQTKGRGRRTNQWQTEFGSLAFSTVCSYSLYSTRTPSSVKGTVQLQPWRSVSFIQYLVALAIVEVVKDDATWKCLPLRIKWPNDLYLDDQKKSVEFFVREQFGRMN